MKKIKQLVIVLLMMLCITLLTGCLDDSGLEISCIHNYELISTDANCTTEGKTVYKCSKCGRELTITEKAKAHNLEIIEMIDSTCSTEGHKKEKCSVCNEVIESVIAKKPHTFNEWTLKTEFVDSTHNLEERECSVCHEVETRLVSTIPEMDLSVINYDITKSTHIATSLEEAAIIFNAAILNNKETFEIKLDFTVTDYDKFFDDMQALRSVPFDYQVTSSYNSGTKVMSLDFTYLNNPSKTTLKEKTYIQAPSSNVTSITKTRANDYDDFKINSCTTSYPVYTTEQLVYVLEHRVKPVPVKNSKAETIYNKIKEVLREIITDDMTDVQKTKAIHDWLIMNVTYDQELVDLMGESDIKTYNGFYLEGVFVDKYAVCEGISKALCVMANIEGIPCVRVSGHQTSNPNGVGHAWNKIYVDGYWYIIDATSDGTIIDGTTEILSYQYFLISEENMKKKYTGEEYTDYACSKDYDFFGNNTIKYNNKTLKLSVTSQNELNELIDYFVKTSETKGTIQFKVNFNYGDKYDDEIATAYSLAHGTKSYGFVRSGDVVLIMLNE